MNSRSFPWIAAGSQGAALGAALAAVLLVFVPLNRARWLEQRSLDELARPDLALFALLAICCALGAAQAKGPLRSLRWGRRSLELLLSVLFLCVVFLGLFSLPPLSRWGGWSEAAFLALGGLSVAGVGWVVALGSWAATSVARWGGSRRLGDGRTRAAVLALLLLLSGKLQPKQEMLAPLRGLAMLVPASWGLECITLLLDGPILGSFHQRRCEQAPALCLPLNRRISLSGGPCSSSWGADLRTPFPDARTLQSDRRLLENLGLFATPAENNKAIEDFLDRLELHVSSCSVAPLDPPLAAAWGLLTEHRPVLLFYRREHLGVVCAGLLMSTLVWIAILALLARFSARSSVRTTKHIKEKKNG